MEESSNSGYKSVIKRWGKPILPPLMTEKRREEMLEYRRLAEVAELRMRRSNVRQYLKSKIGELFEKYRHMHSTSATLIDDTESQFVALNEESGKNTPDYLNSTISSRENASYRPIVEQKHLDNMIYSSLLNIEPPSVEFRIIPQQIGQHSTNISESVLNEKRPDVSLRSVSPSDVYISLPTDEMTAYDFLIGSQSQADDLNSNFNISANIHEKKKVSGEIEMSKIAQLGDTGNALHHQDFMGLCSENNESDVSFLKEIQAESEIVSGNAENLTVNPCSEEFKTNCENQEKCELRSKETDFSPSSRVTTDDSETSFHTVTPSTDLEKYMDSSAETLTSPSAPKSPESLDCSMVTDFSSKSEDVTVINLSSGTTTPVTHEDVNTNKRHSTSVLKDVLNVLSDVDSDGGDLNLECGKQRIRRNSYTLESPSPVLMRALERNKFVGPASEFIRSPVHAMYLDQIPHTNTCSLYSYDVRTKSSKESQFPDRHDILSKEDGLRLSQKNCKESSFEPTCLTNQRTVFRKASERGDQNNTTEKSNNLRKGILHYSEQQISMLQTKQQELRSYLDTVGGRIGPTRQMEIDPPTRDVSSMQDMVIPVSMIRDMMMEQEERLEQIRQQLIEEHHHQMAVLFEQQQLQWQKLAAFIHDQDDVAPLDQSIEVEDVPVHSVQAPVSEFFLSENLKQGKEKAFSIPLLAMDPIMKPKFDRISAAVKGYLIRKLMKSDKVQSIIQTIRDTVECALKLHAEFPQKEGRVTEQDALLHQRLIVQLNSACHEFHDIFFSLSTSEKMSLIAQTRNSTVEKSRKISSSQVLPTAYVSAATMKVLARKHRSPLEGQTFKCHSPLPNYRSHSCPPNRHSPQSPSSWRSPLSGRNNRTLSRKVKKISTKPFRP